MIRSFIVFALGMASIATLLDGAEPVNTQKRRDELTSLKWGMFICWSFSTFSGREWTPGVTDVEFFRAKECDADQWARTAKKAGMGYILFLTKHYDGFCLWDTKTTDRKVTRAPLGRDVLAEFTYPILPPHQGGAMWFYSLPKHDNSSAILRPWQSASSRRFWQRHFPFITT